MLTVKEMGIIFPIPFTLEMDNNAARVFCLGSAHKTKLKHINRQQECLEWVRTLHNRAVICMTPVHVDADLNDSDICTKILRRGPFEKVRNRTMVEHNVHGPQ